MELDRLDRTEDGWTDHSTTVTTTTRTKLELDSWTASQTPVHAVTPHHSPASALCRIYVEATSRAVEYKMNTFTGRHFLWYSASRLESRAIMLYSILLPGAQFQLPRDQCNMHYWIRTYNNIGVELAWSNQTRLTSTVLKAQQPALELAEPRPRLHHHIPLQITRHVTTFGHNSFLASWGWLAGLSILDVHFESPTKAGPALGSSLCTDDLSFRHSFLLLKKLNWNRIGHSVEIHGINSTQENHT